MKNKDLEAVRNIAEWSRRFQEKEAQRMPVPVPQRVTTDRQVGEQTLQQQQNKGTAKSDLQGAGAESEGSWFPEPVRKLWDQGKEVYGLLSDDSDTSQEGGVGKGVLNFLFGGDSDKILDAVKDPEGAGRRGGSAAADEFIEKIKSALSEVWEQHGGKIKGGLAGAGALLGVIMLSRMVANRPGGGQQARQGYARRSRQPQQPHIYDRSWF